MTSLSAPQTVDAPRKPRRALTSCPPSSRPRGKPRQRQSKLPARNRVTETPIPAYPDTVEILPYALKPVSDSKFVSDLHWLLVKAMWKNMLMADVAQAAKVPLDQVEGLANGTIKPYRNMFEKLRRLAICLGVDSEYLVESAKATPSPPNRPKRKKARGCVFLGEVS